MYTSNKLDLSSIRNTIKEIVNNTIDVKKEVARLQKSLLAYKGNYWINIEKFIREAQKSIYNDEVIIMLQNLLDEPIIRKAISYQRFKLEYNKLYRYENINDLPLKLINDILSQAKKAYETIEYNYVNDRDDDKYTRELSVLTKCIKGTSILLESLNKPNAQDLKAYIRNIKEAVGMNSNLGKLIAGSMIAIFGFVLISLAIALAVGTFGAAAPLSAAGIAFSGAIIAAAGSFFANQGRKGTLIEAFENLSDYMGDFFAHKCQQKVNNKYELLVARKLLL